MRRKSGKSEKIVVLMETFMGLLLNIDLRNPKKNGNCHRCGIYEHFARECIAPHPIQENKVSATSQPSAK
jgi:hypothetical protein